MSKPLITIHDALTGITEVREMTDEECAQWQEDQANAPTPLGTENDN